MLFFLISVLILVADFITKRAVLEHLTQVNTVPLWVDVFHLTYVENRGAAFGMLQNQKWFFIVLLLDALKGATPVLLAKYLTNDPYGINAVLASIFVIIGHSKPIFLQFKGGKSVASGVGTILALNFFVGLAIAAIWGTITYISKYVSLGSIIALAISPILMYFFKNPIGYVAYCAIAAIYIIYLHRENIKRLIKGEENKVR